MGLLFFRKAIPFLVAFISIITSVSQAIGRQQCEDLFSGQIDVNLRADWQNLRQDLAMMALDLELGRTQVDHGHLERLFWQKMQDLARHTGHSLSQEIEVVRNLLERTRQQGETKRADAESKNAERQRELDSQRRRVGQRLRLKPVLDSDFGTQKVYDLDLERALLDRDHFKSTSVQFSRNEDYVLINFVECGIAVFSLATGDKLDVVGQRALFSSAQDIIAVTTSRDTTEIRKLPSLEVLSEFPGRLATNPATFGADWILTQDQTQSQIHRSYTLRTQQGVALNLTGPYSYDSVSGRLAFFDSEKILKLYDVRNRHFVEIPHVVSGATELGAGLNHRYFTFAKVDAGSVLDLRTGRLMDVSNPLFEESGLILNKGIDGANLWLEISSYDHSLSVRRDNLESFPFPNTPTSILYQYRELAGTMKTEVFDVISRTLRSAPGTFVAVSQDLRYFYQVHFDPSGAKAQAISFFDTLTGTLVEKREIPGKLTPLSGGLWLQENKSSHEYTIAESLDSFSAWVPTGASAVVPKVSPSGAYLVTFAKGRFQVQRIER